MAKRKTLKDRVNNGVIYIKANVQNQNAERYRYRVLTKNVNEVVEQPRKYFITFTISNDYLYLKKSTIERKIKEALGGASCWVANRDYGGEKNRLHYHAVAGFISKLDYNTILDIYKYGAVNFKIIRSKNSQAIRNYMSKHAYKSTSTHILYSRKKRKEL